MVFHLPSPYLPGRASRRFLHNLTLMFLVSLMLKNPVQAQTRAEADHTLERALAGFELQTAEGLQTARPLFLRAARAYENLQDSASAAAAYVWLGQTESLLSDYTAALVSQSAGLLYATAVEDRELEAIALHELGDLHRSLGRADSAVHYLGRSLRVAKELGDPWLIAPTLANLGGALVEAQYPDSALRVLPLAHQEALKLEDSWLEAVVQNTLGEAHRMVGNPDSAIACFRAGLEVAVRFDLQGEEAVSRQGLTELADSLVAEGNRIYDNVARQAVTAPHPDSSSAGLLQALERFLSAASVYSFLGARSQEADVIAQIMLGQGLLGEHEGVRVWAPRGIEASAASGNTDALQHIYMHWANSEHATGGYEEAARLWGELEQAIPDVEFDPEVWVGYLSQRGNAMYLQGDFAGALEAFKARLVFETERENWFGRLGSLLMVGGAFSELAFDLAAAGEVGEPAQQQADRAARVALLRDSALVFLQTAVTESRIIGLPGEEARALGAMADLLESSGRYDEALECLDAARLAQERTGDRPALADLQVARGSLLGDRGALGAAATAYEEAVTILRLAGDSLGVAKALIDLADLHSSLGLYVDAATELGYARTAALAAVHDGQPLGVGFADAALGMQRMVQVGTAVREAEAAGLDMIPPEERDRLRTLLLEDLEHLTTSDDPLGLSASTAEQLEDFLEFLTEATTSAPDLSAWLRKAQRHRMEVAGDALDEGYAFINLAGTHTTRGEAGPALAYADSALERAQELGSPELEAEAQLARGRILQFQLQVPDNAGAAEAYRKAAIARRALGSQVGRDRLRVAADELHSTLYGDWILAVLAQEHALGIEGAALAALAVSELGRAQALLELVTREDPNLRFDGLQEPEQGWGVEGLEMAGRSMATAAARTGALVLSYYLAGDSLMAWVVRPGQTPVVHGLPLILTDPEADEEDLGPNRVYAAKRRADIALNSVANTVALLRSRLGATWEQGRSLEATRSSVRGRLPSGESNTAAQTLSRLLIPPGSLDGLPGGTEIVVIPFGSLAQVPFAMLPVSSEAGRSRVPLGSLHPVSYAPSLETYLALATAAAGEAGRSPAGGGRALVVGNPTMPPVRDHLGEVAPLTPLPGAEREAKWLGDFLGADPLLGPEAMEEAVWERWDDAPVVHFATHGFAYSSEVRARESFVALAPGFGEDGLLTVREVMDRPGGLSTDLVVLSACQTGLGAVTRSQGVVGFQRAFLARGAKAVLVSLWNVSDEATELLMRGFYRHWMQDPDAPSKAEALRRAQEDLRADPRYEHPRFWAAFQLVGGG